MEPTVANIEAPIYGGAGAPYPASLSSEHPDLINNTELGAAIHIFFFALSHLPSITRHHRHALPLTMLIVTSSQSPYTCSKRSGLYSSHTSLGQPDLALTY